MAIQISQPTGPLCIQHNRFKSDRSWRLSDVCVSETDMIAVSGYHSYTERTFIDLYNVSAELKKPQPISSIEFESHVGLKSRFVCFLERNDNMVTCIGDLVEIVSTRENKTLEQRVLKGLVGYLTTWDGNIFVGFDNFNTVHEYDQQLNLLNVINLKGIPYQDSCVDMHFSTDACFVCTTGGRAMKLSTKGKEAMVYDFDDPTKQRAKALTVSVKRGVVLIVWQWNNIGVYSVDVKTPILAFNVDNAVYRIRMSHGGSIVTGYHYTGEVKVYNVADLFMYDHLKQTLSGLLTTDHCVQLANCLEVDLHLKSTTDSSGKLLFDVLETNNIMGPFNVERLTKALLKLDMKSPHAYITDMFQKLRPSSIVHPHVLYPKHMDVGSYFSSVTFSNVDPKRKRAQTETTDNKGYPKTNAKKKILHTAGEPSSDYKENLTQTPAEHVFLRVEATIGQSGGTLEISNARVKLNIPPDALPEKVNSCFIQLRIIPQGMVGDETTSTLWNTSTVVELLPNNLQLRKHVKLILPHCFVLKRPRPSAKVLVSHHQQGNIPLWVEEADCNCMIETTTCSVNLKRFCWVRLKIDDKEILAKKLVLYTAGKRPVSNCNKFTVVVGYYPDLPGEDKFFQLNPSLIVTERKIFNYYKERENPLLLSSTETIPDAWKLCAPKHNIEEINFATISSSIEHSRPFTFQNKGKRNELPILHFKASQEEGMQPVELTINLEELRDRSPQPEKSDSDLMKRLCWDLSGELTGEWKTVGRNLNVTDAKLNQIEVDNAGNIKETIYAMFLHWLQHGGTNAKRSTLSSALKDAGRADLTSFVDSV